MEERQEVIHGVGKGDIDTKHYVEFHLVLLAADGERVRLWLLASGHSHARLVNHR